MKINLDKLTKVFWGLVLISLPVTSFRYFPFLGKSTYVRPLAFYPLALLFFILAIRLVRKEIAFPWNNALLPLVVFLFFILFSTTAGALLAPIPMRGQEYWNRVLRAFITLAIGLSFFLATLWMHKDLDDLQFSLKWLYAGLILTIIWVGVQAISFYTPLLSREQVTEWQLLFSVRNLLPKLKRVSGFAFEPSWLAGQIATLYLPWLVASMLTNFRVMKQKWIEPALLILALGALVLTYSRGGLLMAAVATFFTLLVTGRKIIGQFWRWMFYVSKVENQRTSQWFIAWGLRAGVLILIVAVLLGTVAFLAEQNYVNRLWTVSADSLSDYFIKTNAGGRATYLWATMKVFLAHPWLGTGLGSSGLYMFQYYPDWALANVPEVTKQLQLMSQTYPNPKNLYMRLFAETGIFGAMLFASFLFAILAETRELLNSQKHKIVGIAGLFSWIAIVLYFLMQDSFAMTELWINFAIVLGLSSFLVQQKKQEKA